MNPVHIYIIAICGMVGLGFALGSFWKGLIYTIWALAALGFWWGVFVVIHALVS